MSHASTKHDPGKRLVSFKGAAAITLDEFEPLLESQKAVRDWHSIIHEMAEDLRRTDTLKSIDVHIVNVQDENEFGVPAIYVKKSGLYRCMFFFDGSEIVIFFVSLPITVELLSIQRLN